MDCRAAAKFANLACTSEVAVVGERTFAQRDAELRERAIETSRPRR
jgi:hypothetical protein